MQTPIGNRLAEPRKTLDTTAFQLQTTRESNWAALPNDLRAETSTDPDAAIRRLVGASEGPEDFSRRYLSGPGNGHSLAERQEIDANGALHVPRTHLHALAKDLSLSGT